MSGHLLAAAERVRREYIKETHPMNEWSDDPLDAPVIEAPGRRPTYSMRALLALRERTLR